MSCNILHFKKDLCIDTMLTVVCQEKSGVPLVAQEKFSEPREVEVVNACHLISHFSLKLYCKANLFVMLCNARNLL